MKVCSRCHINKPDSDFWKQKTGKQGLGSYCKQCCKIASTEYRRKKGIPALRRREENELPKYKICTRCKLNKPKSDFRVRKDKGSYWMINPTCKKCDVEVSRINYNKKKNDPDFKAKNRKRAKEYTEKHLDKIRMRRDTPEYRTKKNEWELNRYYRKKDEIAAKNKRKRQTPEYKAKMKAYRDKNKAKIYKQEVVTKSRYHEKHKSAVTEKYAINQLRQEGNLNPSKNEIDIKRSKILIHRINHLIDSSTVGINKVCSICKFEKDLSQFWKTNRNSTGRVAFCRSCGAVRNQEQKNKRNERHSKPEESPI